MTDRELRIYPLFGGKPILQLMTGLKSSPLSAAVGSLRDHCQAPLGVNRHVAVMKRCVEDMQRGWLRMA
jgi:hypothetical protein